MIHTTDNHIWEGLMTRHNVWKCDCEDCTKWREDTVKIRYEAFERSKQLAEAHKATDKSELHFP